MGAAAVKPSIAVSKLLRERRAEHKLTLRAVSDRLAERGERIPVSTLARIEQGKLDPGVRRLHMLLELYRVPPHLVADLVELELIAEVPPVEGDLETLYANGVAAWKRGDFPTGLACFFAIRKQVPADEESKLVRQRATLGFSIAARNLGKFRLAKQMVDDLLCEPPSDSLLINVLVEASSLWRGLGSFETALALVRQAATHLDPGNSPESAWIRHQEARLLLEDGKLADAERLLDAAIEHYRTQSDPYGEAKALNLRTGLLRKSGDPVAALATAGKALQLAEEHQMESVRLGAQLEMGQLQVETGKVEEGLRMLSEGLGEAVRLGNRRGEFLAHYYLWKTHEKLDDTDRARFELQAARYFVRFIDDHSPEADEVRRLLDGGS